MNTVYPLNRDQITNMIKWLGKNRNKERDVFMFKFMLSLPLRVSDVSKIKVEDVLDKEMVKLIQTKTNKKVELVISDQLKKQIKEYVENNNLQEHDYMFTSRKGGKLTTTQIYRIIKAAAEKSRIEFDVGCHSTRKTWALNALEVWGYERITTISKMLGHSSVESTKYYLHLTQAEDRELVRQLPVF